jgi:hypothetical protein
MVQLLDEKVFAVLLLANKNWDEGRYFNELSFSSVRLEIAAQKK